MALHRQFSLPHTICTGDDAGDLHQTTLIPPQIDSDDILDCDLSAYRGDYIQREEVDVFAPLVLGCYKRAVEVAHPVQYRAVFLLDRFDNALETVYEYVAMNELVAEVPECYLRFTEASRA